MAEFFLSPEAERAVEREIGRRQQQFAVARQQANTAQAQRLAWATQTNPNASNQLKDAFAASDMSEDEFYTLSQREAAQRDDGGFVADIGRALNSVGMGIWNQVVKPSVRGAFTLWDAAQEELVLRPLTAAIASQDEGVSFGQAYRDYGDSALVNIVQGDLASTTTDEQGNQVPITDGILGQGFFPGGRAQAQSNQERQRLQIDGQAGNLGRAIAHGIFADEGGLFGEMYGPGDSAYDITAGVAQFAGEVALDPVAWATAGASTAIKGAKGVTGGARTLGSAIRTVPVRAANDAARQISEAGLVASSRRNTVLLEQAERLFKNRKVLDEIAQADEYTIWRRMKMDRIGLGRGDDRMADLITRLGEANDPRQVSEILIDAAQRGYVRERGFYKGAGRFLPNPKERWRSVRMEGNLPEFRYGGINPERMVSVNNKMEAARDIDGLLRLGKVGEADRANIIGRVFRAADNDEMLGIVDDSVRAIGKRMEDVGVDSEDVEDLLRSHRESINETTGYLLDEAGRPSPPPWKATKQVTLEDGTIVDMDSVSAGLIVNLNKKSIPLPDPTDVRRATAKYSGVRRVYQSAGWEMGTSVARGMNRYLFKFPTLFTRLAYPLRNALDNNARTAGAGYASLFSNPKAWWALGVREPNKFRDLIMSADGALDVGRGFRTADGRYGIVDEIIEGGEGEPTRMVARWRETDETFEVADMADFRKNQVQEVSKTFKEVAEGTGGLTHSASGLWENDGARALGTWRTYYKGQKGDIKAWRNQLGRLHNDPIASLVADTDRWLNRDELIDHIIDNGLVDEVSKLGEDARRFFEAGGTAPSRIQVSEYIDWIEGHIDNLTGRDGRLRRMLADGNLNGVNFNDLTKNKRIDQILREQYYDRMPQQVMGDTFIDDAPRGKTEWKRFMDKWVEAVASRPENRYTRYPLMAQVFADDLATLMPSLADDALRADLVRRASEAGFDDRLFGQIAQAAQNAAGQKGVVDNVEDLIDAAKHHSSDRMLDIAFDATQRSSFQEMADSMIPFWDAFAEVGTSWGRIVRDNPHVIMRGMQAFEGGRGGGFIYTNEMGEEVFAMPGGGTLARMLGMQGARGILEGPVEGLNLVTQGFGPGVGPLVQWGVGAFMPDTPDLQWARDVLTPYGTAVEAPSDFTPGNIIDDLTPAWIEKALTAWSDGDYDPVAWNSAAGDVMKVLATSGNYDMSNPEEVRRLQDDIKKGARWTMWVRSILQMGAPTGPQVEWEIQSDPDGRYHRVATMAGAYYELLQETGDQSTATQAFIDTYGVEPFWIAQGKNNELVEGPRTREGWNWIGRHGDAAEKYPEVIGHFVPAEDPSAPPDYGVFQQRRNRGDIQSLTPEQQLALANKNKARTIYNVWREKTSELPSSQRTAQLKKIRDGLTVMFPGWDTDVLGVEQGMQRDRKIELLEQAVQDEALADSPVTEPLSVYLTKRQQANAILAERSAAGGASTLAADANTDLREWLYGIGQELSVRSPHFQGVWQTVLSSEVDAA